MGLCLMLRDDSKEMNIRYGEFYELRQEIADKFENVCNEILSGDELDSFLEHSDCDGEIKYKDSEIYYNVLKILNVKHERFKELKEILKASFKNKQDIIFC